MLYVHTIAASGKEMLQTQMPGEKCMTNMHTTYEHQLITTNHFQNKPNFESTMYAFLLLLFNNEVYSKEKSKKKKAENLLQLLQPQSFTLRKSSLTSTGKYVQIFLYT